MVQIFYLKAGNNVWRAYKIQRWLEKLVYYLSKKEPPGGHREEDPQFVPDTCEDPRMPCLDKHRVL
jgi:hypothetical protein